MKKIIDKIINRRDVLKYTGLTFLGGFLGAGFSPRNAQARPGLAHASWIHGHSMQIEFPDRLISVWRAGFFIRIEGKSNTNNWFHFAIPTPVIVDDNRLRAHSVMLVFRTNSEDAIVRDIHIYDGDKKIAVHNRTDKTGAVGSYRWEVPGHPEVHWGVGISIGVDFRGSGARNRMEFISAGCDFLP